jgi:capsid portal protein
MGYFGFAKQDTSIQVESVNTYQAFNTPFMSIPKGNLSLPFVYSRFETRGYIPFGADNLYPQHLDQLYFSSPLHGAIVDFKVNASVGGGYEIEEKLNAKDKVELLQFLSNIGLKKHISMIAKTDVVHNRVYFLVDVENGKGRNFRYIHASKVRISKCKTKYSVNEDWSNSMEIRVYEKYTKKCIKGTYIIPFEQSSLGQDFYPIPSYTSSANFAFLSGELSYLQKSNIQNAVFPSFAMLFPKKPQSSEEMETIKNSVKDMKGAENAGKPVAFFANAKDQLPEIVNIPTQGNDGLFRETSELNTEQICFSHTIDPILMGVRTTGSLGSGSDIKQAYIIFEKNVIIPLRTRVEDIVNTLFDIAGLKATLSITNFQIINETIVEIEEEGSATMDALNSMSPLVATKVLESMSENEIRALAGLPPVKGGEKTKGQVEREIIVSETVTTPSATPTSQPSATEQVQAETDMPQVNEALKGLSAKENQDMMRIVREYSKGRLPEAMAKARLSAYGLSDDIINEILGV